MGFYLPVGYELCDELKSLLWLILFSILHQFCTITRYLRSFLFESNFCFDPLTAEHVCLVLKRRAGDLKQTEQCEETSGVYLTNPNRRLLTVSVLIYIFRFE